jgi:hypothetical protein
MLALLAASCRLGDSGDDIAINVEVGVDKDPLPIDESMTITVTARNVGSGPITLTGPSNCLLYAEVLDNSGQRVWQSLGTCEGSNVTEELAVDATKVQTITWFGTNDAGARLASGLYYIRGVARLTGAPLPGALQAVALE